MDDRPDPERVTTRGQVRLLGSVLGPIDELRRVKWMTRIGRVGVCIVGDGVWGEPAEKGGGDGRGVEGNVSLLS